MNKKMVMKKRMAMMEKNADMKPTNKEDKKSFAMAARAAQKS